MIHYIGIVGLMTMLMGCTYQAAIHQLPPDEQAELHAYSKMMTSGQVRTYLSKKTASERDAYLRAIGVDARFQALPPEDREAVLAGQIRRGMSAEALRFLWGDPYYTEGRRDYYERWFYRGSSFSLGHTGDDRTSFGSQVEVHLTDGQVTDWVDVIPTTPDDPGESNLVR